MYLRKISNGRYNVTSAKNFANSDSDKSANVGPEAGRFRTILPQVLATTVKNFLLLDLGLSAAFPTIVIPALTGLNNENNPNETITLTAAQASWLGSIAYLFKLCGSLLSGWIAEPIGRKRAMFFVNIPHLVAWTMLYYSTTLTEVFVAHILLGLGVGLMEAPIITYVGEICEPSVRGVLMAMAGISATLGLFIVFLLGSLTEWRNVALFCLTIPIVTMVAIYFIPETPMWLLSKNREADALKSLQWLRGWVSPKAVQNEFDGIKRYSEFSSSCANCIKAKKKCSHPPPVFKQKLKELVRKRTLKPFFIIIIAASISHFAGMHHLMPYIVQILNSYGSPISPNWATVALGVTGICATITCVITVKFIGKRTIHLVALSGVCLSNIILGIYGFYHLPPGCTSYNSRHLVGELTNSSFFPLIMFVILRFCTTGIALVPFMLLSELFPFKSRGLATGFTGAASFIIAFVAVKSFYNLESWLSLQGAMLLYGGIGLIGLIVVYNILPETENRTLEDIEIHFSDNNRKLTDRNIAKIAIVANVKETMDDRAKALHLRTTDTEKTDVIKNGEKQENKIGYRNKGFVSDNA